MDGIFAGQIIGEKAMTACVVVFHWKYNLDDIDVSEEVIVDTLPLKKSS